MVWWSPRKQVINGTEQLGVAGHVCVPPSVEDDGRRCVDSKAVSEMCPGIHEGVSTGRFGIRHAASKSCGVSDSCLSSVRAPGANAERILILKQRVNCFGEAPKRSGALGGSGGSRGVPMHSQRTVDERVRYTFRVAIQHLVHCPIELPAEWALEIGQFDDRHRRGATTKATTHGE